MSVRIARILKLIKTFCVVLPTRAPVQLTAVTATIARAAVSASDLGAAASPSRSSWLK